MRGRLDQIATGAEVAPLESAERGEDAVEAVQRQKLLPEAAWQQTVWYILNVTIEAAQATPAHRRSQSTPPKRDQRAFLSRIPLRSTLQTSRRNSTCRAAICDCRYSVFLHFREGNFCEGL